MASIHTISDSIDSRIVRDLRAFDFSIADYFINPDAVLKDALRMTPGSVDSVIAVRDYLFFRYTQKVNESLEWRPFPLPVHSGDSISVVFDNCLYTSIIRFDKSNLEVILFDVEHPTTKSLSLPNDTCSFFTNAYDSACSVYGLLKAKEIILALVLKKHYLRKV